MKDTYDFRAIEKYWQDVWERDGTLNVDEESDKPKVYVLDMFPGPSGPLHMGHVKNYVIGDVVARYRIRQGENVFHPMGWDAFGLPAEIAAIVEGVHPREWTDKHIGVQKRQFRSVGIHHDWSAELNTSDSEYYRWNQWLFLKLYEHGLAYQAERAVNWCPKCQTTLANEEVVAGACERCDTEIVEKPLQQWFLKITAYADALLKGLDNLPNWPDRIKTMQRHWIGRSAGAEVCFDVPEYDTQLTVFTTRPDTLFGVTFIALSVDHPMAKQVGCRLGVDDRGVDTGVCAIHPVTQQRIPIWVADYVLMDYGTGSVMGVPAHDERDFDFAQTHGLPIQTVVESDEGIPNANRGRLIHSGAFTGQHSDKACENIAQWLHDHDCGGPKVTFKLRDWCISRQRYWGTPIPIVHCDACGTVPVPESDLPVCLPDMTDFAPDGRPPLSRVVDFVQTTCPQCGGSAERECDTMTGFVCSSWYFLRFFSPHCHDQIFDAEAVCKGMPVAHYIGGKEHGVGHLMYSRFITRFLNDMGLVNFVEPFTHLFNQGVVCKDGSKMSKSRGNVVSIEDMVAEYGADTARMFVLFATPPDRDMDWSEDGVEGIHRFLNRVWRIVSEEVETPPGQAVDEKVMRVMHQAIRSVTEDMVRFHYNTAISRLMELTTAIQQGQADGVGGLRVACETLVLLMAPFAPHIAEALWHRLGYSSSVHGAEWPTYDVDLVMEQTVEVAVQVNGKMRDAIQVQRSWAESDVIRTAHRSRRVSRHLGDRAIQRTVYVPNRLVNFVTKK